MKYKAARRVRWKEKRGTQNTTDPGPQKEVTFWKIPLLKRQASSPVFMTARVESTKIYTPGDLKEKVDADGTHVALYVLCDYTLNHYPARAVRFMPSVVLLRLRWGVKHALIKRATSVLSI